MNSVVFLTAQHMATYYLWQLKVCISNLASKGVSKQQIQILFATRDDEQLSNEDKLIVDFIEKSATTFYYPDERKEKNYSSSVRPHILAKHFLQFPELKGQTICYHDCDILFREMPPLFKEEINDTWYVSNTKDYLNSGYVKGHIGNDGFIQLCGIVGVEPSSVEQQDENCGGSQYVMKNLTASFWEKVEKDSERIYIFLNKLNLEKNIERALSRYPFNYSKGIQSWCADMWAVLWNAIYFNQKVKIHSDLDFSWPKNGSESWDKRYILHNAGVEQNEAEKYFYKGNYKYQTPFFEPLNYVCKESCSFIYSQAVNQIAKSNSGIPLLDFTFLIPAMIDSPDRLDNLLTSVRYLQKHFDTHINILEYGRQPKINPKLLPKMTIVRFVQGESELFHRTFFNNQLVDAACTPFISIYDTDVIIPAEQILKAVRLLREYNADMVYPYDGSFISIDKLASVIFSKFLDQAFFEENEGKFGISSRRSVGGCVMLNRESFIKAGKENEKFNSWGPEDVERYNRMKILGYEIRRVPGPLYHMYHERRKNSRYSDWQKRIEFMEEYRHVFNMKKIELEEYISNWQ